MMIQRSLTPSPLEKHLSEDDAPENRLKETKPKYMDTVQREIIETCLACRAPDNITPRRHKNIHTLQKTT
ncbi:hypothetical protein TNCV_3099571 [Trichonephila clavipes]|nr:hypothetical protein TNCV_3099571 [Trichonephila clavipes]